MQTLSGRTCVFAGAAGGDGTSAVKALCAGGMNVVIMTHSPEAARKLVEEIEKTGCAGECMAYESKPGQGPAELEESVYREIADRYGSVDVIICNTGSAGLADDIATLTGDALKRSFDHLVVGSYEMMRTALPFLKNSRVPRVIFMTTVEGCRGSAWGSLSNAVAKGAVRSLTLNAAARLASEGITVNCISKGAIERAEPYRDGTPDIRKRLASIPLGRTGTPEDLAQAICFLASEESGYITGQVLELNGGLNLGI